MNASRVTLGDIFEVARGGSPRPIDDYITDNPDGLNWVMIGDASASDKIITRTKKRIRREGLSKTRSVEPGDFILSNSMSFGRPYIMGINGCIHDGWLLLRPRTTQIDCDYFYHLLGSPGIYASFASRAAGATVKNLNSEIVREVEVPLPPLPEQKRIAAILDQADALRRLRRRALDRLNTLGQAIFHEMFGARLEGADTIHLSDLTTKIGSGATPRGGDTSYKASGIPLIRSMNVRDGHFSQQGLAFIDNAQAAALINVEVKAGDVLLNITGASVARVCIAPKEMEGARVNQHVAIIRPKNSMISEFLEAFLLLPATKSKLLKIAESGATRQAITKSQIADLLIPMIPRPEQEEFVRRVSAAADLRMGIVEHGDFLQSLFTSLQHRAFQGEL